MHKVVIGAGVVCLICVAAITGMLIAGKLFPVDQLSVFDAVEGSSYEIFLADSRTRHALPITHHFASDRFPALSPDGQQVAFVSWRDGNSEIYVMDLGTQTERNLSQHSGQDSLPSWSPDGRMLAYTSSYRQGTFDINLVNVVFGESGNRLRGSLDSESRWSVDSQQIVFISDHDGATRVLRQYSWNKSGR